MNEEQEPPRRYATFSAEEAKRHMLSAGQNRAKAEARRRLIRSVLAVLMGLALVALVALALLAGGDDDDDDEDDDGMGPQPVPALIA